jgi:hypothetical protein
MFDSEEKNVSMRFEVKTSHRIEERWRSFNTTLWKRKPVSRCGWKVSSHQVHKHLWVYVHTELGKFCKLWRISSQMVLFPANQCSQQLDLYIVSIWQSCLYMPVVYASFFRNVPMPTLRRGPQSKKLSRLGRLRIAYSKENAACTFERSAHVAARDAFRLYILVGCRFYFENLLFIKIQ